jgi:short-subunit dehydrogenase
MRIVDSTVLVTGANRGLGAEFVQQLLKRGAKKIYATARNAEQVVITDSRVESLQLDVTSNEDIAAVIAHCSDVTVLINNAGINHSSALLSENAVINARNEMNANVFGPMTLATSFAPTLASNGGGAIVNIASVMSWLQAPLVGTYAMSKSALWSLTNGLRLELAGQKTQVVGVYPAGIATDMGKTLGPNSVKSEPADIVSRVLDGLEAGEVEILPDDTSKFVKSQLSNDIATFYAAVAKPAQ